MNSIKNLYLRRINSEYRLLIEDVIIPNNSIIILYKNRTLKYQYRMYIDNNNNIYYRIKYYSTNNVYTNQIVL